MIIARAVISTARNESLPASRADTESAIGAGRQPFGMATVITKMLFAVATASCT